MSQPEPRYRPGVYHRGEDTRRRILETALDVFAVEGYEGASTRVLAERAGVNLPAIQYYFGSKEGLYRAVIEHIVQQIHSHMAPIRARVDAALARRETPREALLALLCDVLDAFIALVVGGEHLESRRLLFARSEIDRTAALDPLHEAGRQQIFLPCAALVSRLIGRPEEDEQTVLRTLLLIGQVTIFCNKGVRRALEWNDFTEDRVRSIQALLREYAMTIFRSAGAATS